MLLSKLVFGENNEEAKEGAHTIDSSDFSF